MSQEANTLPETVTVETMEVSCDGGGGALGHPKVYLHLATDNGSVVCPYCSKTFVLKAGFVPGGGH